MKIKLMSNVRGALLSAFALMLTACISSGPATKFYALFPNENMSPSPVVTDLSFSLGIGPVVMPEYLDNSAIVSRASSQRLSVAGYHAWAGDLKENVSRVLAGNLSSALDQDAVWAFPWDTRVRPDYQLRIIFDRYDGMRGGEVVLNAKWTLLKTSSDEVLAIGSESISEVTTSESVDAYVVALNGALNSFSEKIAAAVLAHLGP